MQGKRSARKQGDRESLGSPEKRLARLLDALRADPALAQSVREFDAGRLGHKARKFGSNALEANGKLFALFTQGTMVVKLPPERVAALVAEGAGAPFEPGHGRIMKGWLALSQPCLGWVGLAREAYAYVVESRAARS
jgi:hypothetical protein